MESSNSELNRTTSAPVKHEHKTSAKLKTFSSEKIQCPSQPTHSFSSSDDPTIEASTPRTQEMEQTPSTSTPVKREHESSTTAKLNEFSSEKILCPSSPTQSSSSSGDQTPIVPEESPTEAPRTQEMERTPSAYRIPPSVFERSQTSSPMEWSTASNESLFSIHMGNMSFTNDQFHTGNMSFTNDQFHMRSSGELNPPADTSTSEQMFSYDSAGGVVAGDMRIHEMELAEATMLEVIKESENQNPTKPFAEVRNARRSEGSNTSNKSFAFSIMGVETGSSTRLHGSLKSNHEQTQPEVQAHAHAHAQPEAKETPIEAGNQAQSSWLSCFSCCSVSK